MSSQEEAFFTGSLKNGGKLGRWIIPLVRVEAHADECIFVGQGFHQSRHGVFGGLVAEEAKDQASRYPQCTLRHQQAQTVAPDDGRERHTSGRVRLGVEEEFDVLDVLRVGTRQVVHGQVAEIMLGLEDAEVRVVDGQERRQVVKGVSRLRWVEGRQGWWEGEVVPLGELAGQAWCEAAFQVDVELALGHSVDECFDVDVTVAILYLRGSRVRRHIVDCGILSHSSRILSPQLPQYLMVTKGLKWTNAA